VILTTREVQHVLSLCLNVCVVAIMTVLFMLTVSNACYVMICVNVECINNVIFHIGCNELS